MILLSAGFRSGSFGFTGGPAAGGLHGVGGDDGDPVRIVSSDAGSVGGGISSGGENETQEAGSEDGSGSSGEE